MNVIGYARVSTSEQSVIAQTNAIHAECDRRGWTMVALYEESAFVREYLRGENEARV